MTARFDQVLLDPNAGDGGGSGSPDPTSGSTGDGSPDTSGLGISEDQMAEVAKQVGASFGLKEGQRIDQMVTGAASKVVRESFGLEKGQNALEVIGGMITTGIAEAIKANSTPSPNGSEDDATKELRADIDALRKTSNELAEAKASADKAAYEERRKGLIRDSLSEFDINPNVKGLVTRGFLQGVEADPQISEEDGESLVIKMADGAVRMFGDYLKGYFTENKSFLSQKTYTGSGPKGGGDGRPSSTASFDFKTSGRELAKKFVEASKEDSEGAIDALKKQNAERAANLNIPISQ